eukprot:gene6019-5325_t
MASRAPMIQPVIAIAATSHLWVRASALEIAPRVDAMAAQVETPAM